jgi:hypothetical protein
VTDREPQFALREWQAHVTHPVTLAALAGTGAVLGLTGPFGTDGLLRLMPRLAYWLWLVISCYALGAFVAQGLSGRFGTLPTWLRVALQGVLTGCGVSALVLVTNHIVFDWLPAGAELPGFLGTIFAICLIVTAILDLAGRHSAAPATAEPTVAPNPAPPPLLDRLPLEKRAPLVALSVEDHYVRIITTKGQEMVLMRLSDAIRETGDSLGAQVHRSHWAGFDHVARVERLGDRALLHMTTGDQIPVSRANLPKLKEAGLLPR